MKKYAQILFMLCISYSMYTMSADNIQPTKCTQCTENQDVISALYEIVELSEQLAHEFELKYNTQQAVIKDQETHIAALESRIRDLTTTEISN